jgi:hypothetical protein
MHLSILIPTHRDDLLACSRLAQACSWAGPELEVIIRDNSGSASKRELLGRFARDHCKIVFAENRGPVENYSETLKLAAGEFVYFVADDDLGFERAMAALPGVIASVAGDRTIVGMTGGYVIENSQRSAVVGYQNLDANDVTARVAGFLGFDPQNVLIYSPVRRALVQRVFDFMNSMPFALSFQDQIICLLYLLNGKFLNIKRLLYLYDAGAWETPALAQERDLAFYTAANLDPAVNKLHWFLCGFEGAVLIRNANIFPDYPAAQRQAMADRWFSTMFLRFKNSRRDAFGSRYGGEADRLCNKLKASAGQLSFHDMLGDLCGFMALSSKENAQQYFNYWGSILSKTNSAVA